MFIQDNAPSQSVKKTSEYLEPLAYLDLALIMAPSSVFNAIEHYELVCAHRPRLFFRTIYV